MRLSSILLLTLILLGMGIFVGRYIEGENTRFALNADFKDLISANNDLPKSRIRENEFSVFADKFVLDSKYNLKFGKIEDTHSMEPALWKGVYTIEFEIGNEKTQVKKGDLKVGDIISYKSKSGRNIIHRIIKIGNDEYGWYARTKGDNNKRTDSELVREIQLIGVVNGMIG